MKSAILALRNTWMNPINLSWWRKRVDILCERRKKYIFSHFRQLYICLGVPWKKGTGIKYAKLGKTLLFVKIVEPRSVVTLIAPSNKKVHLSSYFLWWDTLRRMSFRYKFKYCVEEKCCHVRINIINIPFSRVFLFKFGKIPLNTDKSRDKLVKNDHICTLHYGKSAPFSLINFWKTNRAL